MWSGISNKVKDLPVFSDAPPTSPPDDVDNEGTTPDDTQERSTMAPDTKYNGNKAVILMPYMSLIISSSAAIYLVIFKGVTRNNEN